MPRKFAKRYIVEDEGRFYFRKKGQPKVRLPGVPGSDEFNAVYYRALRGEVLPKRTGPKLATKGTLRWLCEQYLGIIYLTPR